MALDGVGFSKYAFDMYDQGREQAFALAERARQEQERARMQQMQDAARQRNEGIFSKFGAYGPAPQPAMPQQAPQAQMGAQPKPVQQGPGRFSSIMQNATQQYGLPAGYLERTAQIESGMNPNAKNPKSTAKGLFQFLDRTAQEYGLANPMDPNASTDAAARLAQKNMRALKAALGRDPTPGELYLAHQQGTQGAIRLLRNPNAPAMQVVGRQALMLNGGDPNMTAGQFASKWTGKFGQGQQPQGVQMASAGGAMPMQMQQQAQAPMAQAPMQQPQAQQMPGSEISTQDLVSVFRDPGSSEEDRAIAKMLLETRFADPTTQEYKRAQIEAMRRETSLLGQPKPVDLPASVREYQFAVQQGFKGSYADWEMQNRRAGATNVTIGAEGDKAFEKELAGGLAKTFTGLMDQGREGAAQRMDIGILRDALQNSPQGLQGGLASIAQSFGVDVTGKGAIQVADAVISKLVPAQRPPGSGPMSDRDVLLFRASLPSLWGSPQGNKIIVDAMEAMVNYKIEAGRIAERVAIGELTRDQGLTAIRGLPDPLATFKASQGRATNTGQSQTGIKWQVVQ
jgi:hypothetical protein